MPLLILRNWQLFEGQMTIEKAGTSGMRLTTVDTDPTTGGSVVTSRISVKIPALHLQRIDVKVRHEHVAGL